MVPIVTYCKDYGWHIGRPLVWFGLAVVGIPLIFGALLVEGILQAVTRLPIPVAIGAPLLMSLPFYVRLKRKLNGEPFAVCLPQFFDDDRSVYLVTRGHRHFRAIVMVECVMWGSVILGQLTVLAVFYGSSWR